MIDLPDDFRDLLVCLHDAGAEIAIVGGYAVAFHGHVAGRPQDIADVAALERIDVERAGRER